MDRGLLNEILSVQGGPLPQVRTGAFNIPATLTKEAQAEASLGDVVPSPQSRP